MTDPFPDYLHAVREAIVALGLEGIQPAEIVVRRLPWNKKGEGLYIIHRGITVHPLPEKEAAGTNEREDIGYGCGVTMVVGNDHSLTDNVDLLPTWRGKIRRRFAHQRIEGVTFQGAHALTTTVEMLDFPVPRDARDAHRYELSSLIIRPWMRESRGT